MATTVGQHSVAAFTSPVNGTTPIDANTVRGNDNTVRVAYVDHDADPGIHVQSSTLASRPTAGTAGRKWITEDSGVYTLWFDDGTNWHPVSSENINLTVLATENLVKGDVVKVTGWNNGQDLPEVVKTTSASDTAFAVITAAVSSGSMGYATNTGIVQDVNTAAYSVGTILYANGSGGFTSTKPTSGHYQPCAYVLRSNTNNGVYYVEFSSPRIVESSANTASTIVQRDASGNFSAGTITAGALTSTGLVTFASLKGTGATTVTNILDEDNMASDSATALATQQSIKAYVDAKVATVDTLAEVLANGNTTGANDIIVNAGQKIRTPLIASQNNATAITIADTTGALTLASALADSNLATISTAGKVSNSATTATSANTASAIVARDASGNFTAGTITATLSGTATQVSQALTAGSYLTSGGTYNGATARTFAVDATDANTASKVVARDASGNFSAGTITATLNGAAPAGSLSGTTLASNVVSSSLTSVGTLTSLTVSGDLTVDTSTLKVDSANNRVGIGTATPSTLFHVRAATNKNFIVQDAGIADTVEISNYNTTDGIRPIYLSASTLSLATGTAGGGSTSTRMSIDASGNLAVDTNTLYVDAANNRVGVGTTSPATALNVEKTGAGNVTSFLLSRTTANTSDEQSIVWKANDLSLEYAGIAAVLNSGTAGSLAFRTATGGTLATKALLDASGNLGLGVTPSAWTAIEKAIEISRAGNGIFSGGIDDVTINSNAYYAGAWKFGANGYANRFNVGSGNGQFQWFVSTTSNSSGAGANATFTQAMTLDASGNLQVGTTTSRGRITAVTTGYSVLTLGTSSTSSARGGAINFESEAPATRGQILYDTASDYMAFGTATTERARIDSSGNLGVGTTSPGIGWSGDAKGLQVTGTGTQASGVRLTNATGNGELFISGTSSVWGLYSSSNIPCLFYTNNTERARITSGGYFKASDAGTYASSTGNYHEFRTSASTRSPTIQNTHATQPFGILIEYTAAAPNGAGNDFVYCSDNAAARAVIRSNGGLANYQANNVDLSDARTKTDITPAASMWDKVAALEIVAYKYIDQTHDDVNLGVIAQQVETVEPVWVDADGFGETPEGEEPFKTVYTKDITFAAIKALQEAMARIEALEARLEALEA